MEEYEPKHELVEQNPDDFIVLEETEDALAVVVAREEDTIEIDPEHIETLAWQVLRGELGIGQERQDKLGPYHASVIERVAAIRRGE